MSTTEQYVTQGFPWVVVAEWRDSSPTLHGGFRTVEAAEQSAGGALQDNPACTRWHVLLMQDPPVPRPRCSATVAASGEFDDGAPLADRIRVRLAQQADDVSMSDDLVSRVADVLAGA